MLTYSELKQQAAERFPKAQLSYLPPKRETRTYRPDFVPTTDTYAVTLRAGVCAKQGQVLDFLWSNGHHFHHDGANFCQTYTVPGESTFSHLLPMGTPLRMLRPAVRLQEPHDAVPPLPLDLPVFAG